jgi:TetR/AcrR family transcriptional repressor of nem operon
MARTREFDPDEMLDKAIELFWNKGYDSVSTQELMAAFDISKSSMYGAFGDKMELFLAALEKYRQRLAEDTERRLSAGKNVKATITALLQSIVTEALADPAQKGCFVVNTCIDLAPHEARAAAIVRDHRKRMEQAFAAAIRRGIENGELAARVDSRAVSTLICTTINGIQVDSRYIRDKKHFASIIRTVADLLVSNS